MSEAIANINWNGHHGIVEYKSGDPLVLFYTRSVHNPVKSAAAGTRIFEDHVYVKIQHPGDNLQVNDRPVRQDDKMRWPQQWAAFQANRSQIPDGTPIDLLFPNHPHVADNLRGLGVHTIEQCSNLSATAMDAIGMGAQDYVNAATDYLDMANKGVNFHNFKRQLEERDSKIRVLEGQLAQMQQTINTITGQIDNRGNVIHQPVQAQPAPAGERAYMVPPVIRKKRQKDEEAA
jgi:hypothetical protein